jgi:hypothetical protein
MVEAARQRRFRLSIRTLMIAIALCAILLDFLQWTSVRVREERLLAELAREQAIQARYLMQVRSAQAALNAAKLGSTNQPGPEGLWAALTVNHSTFKQGQTRELRMEFSLVNDGEMVIDPRIAESRILINGKEIAGSQPLFSGVPKDVRFKALAPGESRQFGFLLGEHFKESGEYRVSWKGAAFESPDILLRVLPDKAR